jgi:hypothetical protein
MTSWETETISASIRRERCAPDGSLPERDRDEVSHLEQKARNDRAGGVGRAPGTTDPDRAASPGGRSPAAVAGDPLLVSSHSLSEAARGPAEDSSSAWAIAAFGG